MQALFQPLEAVHASNEEGRMIPMDPHLQKLIVLRRSGIRKKASASTSADELSVVAKVTSTREWINMTEVRDATIIGPAENQQGNIVTGRIPIKMIESVRTQPFVLSLKAARKLRPALAATVREIEADAALPKDMISAGGKGVVVGIIDFGCDFTHLNFIKADGKTRIKKLWNQAGEGAGTGVKYGDLFTEGDINDALTKTNPYAALNYFPEAAAHGTHVMDIAAGNGNGSRVPGVAPEADIIFVELDGSDIPWEGKESVGKSFGDSVQLLEALAFIFQQAGNRPCVINASLATNGGPHDGTTLVEQGIDSLVQQKPNRAVVIAAANSFADKIHAAGEIKANATHDLSWIVPDDDITENEFELWYEGKGRLEVELIDPSGKSLGAVPPNESGTVKDSKGKLRAFIVNRLDDPNNHDNAIGIFLNRGTKGTWTVRLKNIHTEKISFHAWIERDDDGQSFFAAPHDNSYTLGSLSCSQQTIAVGSYDAHKKSLPLSYFSSAGPTRDGRQKPEISAPGHDVKAARSRSTNHKGVTTMSGTSMASPAVTGAIALLLAEAKARGIQLSNDEIRKLVIASARKKPPAGKWHERYGFGRISAKRMITGLPASKKKTARKKTKNKPSPRRRKGARGV